MNRTLILAAATAAATAALGGCGSGANQAAPTIPAAKTYSLQGFQLGPKLRAGKPLEVSFAIAQPSGALLTAYKHGPGPHTGVHLILVRSDLGAIVHIHPPVGADGKVHGTPRIASAIFDGYRIDGFNRADAERLATAISNGCRR